MSLTLQKRSHKMSDEMFEKQALRNYRVPDSQMRKLPTWNQRGSPILRRAVGTLGTTFPSRSQEGGEAAKAGRVLRAIRLRVETN